MNIEELKKLVKQSTAVLVLDEGEPSFAILSYDMYKDLVLNGKEEREIKVKNAHLNGYSPKTPLSPEAELEILERINKDILALKSEIEREEKILGSNISLD